MRTTTVQPTGVERSFGVDELIVSKTDAKGHLVYANDIFCRMAAAREEDLLGRPHNIIRHPDMPSAIYKYLWETIAKRQEVFAYVKNLALDGTHYWVFAHVTATGRQGEPITGYHSNRRFPARDALHAIEPFYKKLRAIEQANSSTKAGLAASCAAFDQTLAERNMTYDEFVWSVTP